MHRRRFVRQAGAAFVGGVASAFLTGSKATAGSPAKTILLKSAWDTVNIGDIGHTPGTLRLCEQYLPGTRVILWAVRLNAAIEDMLRRRFPQVEIVQGDPGKADAAGETLRHAFAQADLCMHNSGMGAAVDLMSFSRQLGKPYGLYGQSYFPAFVEGKEAAGRIGLLNGAAFVYCRESHTLETLRHAGVKTPVLEFAPDGCFGIDVRDDARALAFMQQAGLEDRKFLTIQLRTQTAKHPGVDNPPLNPLHPSAEMIAADERRAAVYRELITLWVRQTGYKVLIAPEVEKEMVHNKRLLFDPLPPDIKTHVVNRDTFWNVDEAASVFARAHTAVCHEPHSLIIALANGTPILHTYSAFHGPKCWMFQDIGLGEWLLEFDSTPAAQMGEKLLAIHADYPAALAKVKQAMEFVHARQAATMSTLKPFLA